MSKQKNNSRREKVALRVNGKVINMNSFVKKMISNTVFGMVKSLRGVKNIKEVKIKLKK